MDTRPLPPGWVSQWEPSVGRYFFVDTTKNPPASSWEDPRDAPPPYSASKESMPAMPIAMPTPNPQSYPASSAYPQYPQDPQYPPSDSKSSTSYTGYPGGQPQPDSYNPYNKYDSTATSSTTATAPKKSGFLSKLGLSSGKLGKPDKSNKYTPPAASYAPALGTAAALGALSHHKPGKKNGLGLGSGIGLGLGGAAAGVLVGKTLFGGHKGFGFGGCDNDWGGGGDWGGDCDW
ncbi:hypothetical protein C1646_101752 [Rhizophagus diaphanus]|nr:hypothetical protein C1646_101752 [Rhizophagus diaphanus] [Rhizophagus sp. MUCL 43196]